MYYAEPIQEIHHAPMQGLPQVVPLRQPIHRLEFLCHLVLSLGRFLWEIEHVPGEQAAEADHHEDVS